MTAVKTAEMNADQYQNEENVYLAVVPVAEGTENRGVMQREKMSRGVHIIPDKKIIPTSSGKSQQPPTVPSKYWVGPDVQYSEE